MGVPRGWWLPRHAFVAVSTIYLSFAVFAEGEMDDITLVSQMDEVTAPAAQGTDDAFNEIEGFAMRAGATVLPGKTKSACEKICLDMDGQDGRALCRSYSYRLHDSQCIWSTASLTFDPDFMFASKTTDPSSHKKYRTFQGMSYRTQGWTIVQGSGRNDCEAMCTGSDACKAYSCRERDKLCLLGPKGITYSSDFNYFEKRGIPYEPFPLLAPGAAYSCTGSLCPKVPEGQAQPSAATEDPKLTSFEGSVKSRMKKADYKLQQAEADEARGKAEIAKDKLKTKEKVHKLRQKDESELSDEEREVINKDNEKLAKEEETLKLDAANEEIEEKTKEAGGSTQAFKERARKSAWTVEQRADVAKERELKDGNRATDLMLEKYAANDEEFAAIRKMMKAKEETADAELADVKKDAEDQWIKEAGQKKIAQADREMNKKTAAANAANEVVGKLAEARADDISQSNAEQLRKQSAEADQKDSIRAQERAREMCIVAQTKEQEVKKEQSSIKAEMDAMEAATKESGREYTEAEAKKYVTLALAHEKAQEAATELQGKANNATAHRENMRLKAEGHSEKLQKMNEQELIRIKEVSDKKESLAKENEQKAASGSSEVSEKSAANATAAASAQEAANAQATDEEAAKVISKGQEENNKLRQKRLSNEADGKTQYTNVANQANSAVSNSQNFASGVVGNAETSAATVEGQADAEAETVEQQAVAAANAGIRQLKVEAEQEAGVVEKHIMADESAYVDSGEKMVGTDMENLENAVLVAQGEETDAQAALATARTALETAAATVRSDQSQVQLVLETKAADAQKAADTIIAVTKGVKQQADIVKTNLDASEKQGKTDGKAAKDATTSLTTDDTDSSSPQFWATSLIDLSLGEHSKTQSAHDLQQADLSAADPDTAVRAAFPAPSATHDWRDNDLELLLHDSLGDDDLMTAGVQNVSSHFNAAKKETGEVVTKHNEQMKQAADNQPTEKEVKDEEARNEERMAEATTKATNKAARDSAQKTFDEATETLEAAVTKANEASANKQTAIDAPANTAYSNCVAENAAVNDCGELKIRSSPEWKMNGYLKFPQSTLRETDAIVEAKLRLYKFGGGTGAIRIFTASCEWDRKDITYTMAEVNPGGLALANAIYGDDSASFPAGSAKWVEIKLHGDILNNARIQGNHICLRVSGGPADANDAVIISSELTDKKPELVLFVKEGAVGAAAATKPESALNDADRAKIEARGKHRLAKMAEYKTEEMNFEKQKVFEATTAVDSPLTELKKKLAVVEQVTGYENLYDSEWAGADDVQKTTWQNDRDTAIRAASINAQEILDMQAQRTQGEPAWLDAEINTMKTTPDASGAMTCCADDADEATKRAELSTQYAASTTTMVETARANLEAAPGGSAGAAGGRIYQQEQTTMQGKVDAFRAQKKHEYTTQISAIRCQTVQNCQLTSDEISTWEARAESRLIREMQRYDNEHGTAPLAAHDIMQAAENAEQLASQAAQQESTSDVTSNPGTDVANDPNGTQVLLQLTAPEIKDEDTLYRGAIWSNAPRAKVHQSDVGPNDANTLDLSSDVLPESIDTWLHR